MQDKILNINTLFTVLNEVGAYIYTKDLDGKYTYANRLVLELFGVTFEEILGKDDYSFFDEDEIESLIENDQRVFCGEVINTEEILTVKRTEEKRYFIVEKKPLYDKDNNVIGMFGISTDITEQKMLEKKILDQKIFLDTILDNVDAFIYMKDENRVFRYVNSKVAALFGRSVDKIIGYKDTDIIPKEIADTFWESDKRVLRTNTKYALEEYFEDVNGKSYYWSIKLPYTFDGKATVLGLSTDITMLKGQEIELKQKDKILYQQSKISTMGEMIENIAHQWRQPLSVISTTATGSKLKKEIDSLDDYEFYENMENINRHAQYLSNTIDDFRNFFLSDSMANLEVDLKQSILKSISLVKDSFKNSNIKLIENLEDGIVFNCKENLFIQAIINIFNNARDVLNQKAIDEKFVFIDLKREKQLYIIKIKDNGNGISEENLDKIFEPYFTTKHKSQGTGIGLYMTYQIVSKHKGASIIAENIEYEYEGKNYKGASFNITIPIDDSI